MKPHSLCHIVAYIHLLFSVVSQKDKRRQSKGKPQEEQERRYPEHSDRQEETHAETENFSIQQRTSLIFIQML